MALVDAARLTHPDAQLVVEDGLPRVRTIDVRARQLLTNLVENALEHGGRPDLRVTVRGRRTDDGGLLLQVADDGVGVPAEYRDRVLRVFERLDAPKSSPGTGMGTKPATLTGLREGVARLARYWIDVNTLPNGYA